MKRLLTAVCLCLCVALLWSDGWTETIVVPSDQPTIQAALDSAQGGDTVLVWPGAWLEQLDFNGKAIVLISQAGPYATVLQPLFPDSHIVRIASAEAPGTELSGFTLRDGRGTALVLLGGGATAKLSNNIFHSYGGVDVVVKCDSARVRLERNLFYGNSGLACVGVYNDTVTSFNNTFDRNTAGLFVLAGATSVRNCVITNSSTYGLSGDSVSSDYNVVWNNVPNYQVGALSGQNDQFADPGFTTPLRHDYTLRDTSICIDAGDPDSLYLDPDSSRADIGAFPLGATPVTLPLATDIDLAGPSLSRVVDSLPAISWRYYDSTGTYTAFELEVGADDDWTTAELWATGQVTSADTILTYGGAPLFDSTTYALRLRVNNGLTWGDWQTVSFRMNARPAPPVPQHPVAPDSVHTDNAVFTVVNGVDGDDDGLLYEFVVYSDSLLTAIVLADSGVAEGATTTSSSALVGLTPGSDYWWRARVTDRYEHSAWSDSVRVTAYQGPRTIRVPSEEPTIKAAITAAASGDTIQVADGLYAGAGNREIDFANKELVLLSENGPSVTIIDCSDSLGAKYDGLRILGTQSAATKVRGFSIRNANNAVTLEASPSLRHLVLENSVRGILTYGTLSVAFDSLELRNNTTGLYAEENPTITIERSRVVNNTVGIIVNDGTLVVDSCRVDSNVTGIELVNAALTLVDGRVSHNATGLNCNIGPSLGLTRISTSVFDSNAVAVYGDARIRTSSITGGEVGVDITFPDQAWLDTVTVSGMTEAALRHRLSRRPPGPIGTQAQFGPPGFLVRHSTIAFNPGLAAMIESDNDGDFNILQIDSSVVADNGGGLVIGGALSMYGSLYARNGGPLDCSVNEYFHYRRRIEACTFVDNDSGAIRVFADSAILEIHRTIVSNNGGEGIRYFTKDSSQPVLLCNNVYNNAGGNYAGLIDSGAFAGSYSEPPRYCNRELFDYAISDISICAPANNSCAAVIGAYAVDCVNLTPLLSSPDTVSVFEDSLLVYRLTVKDVDGPDTLLQFTAYPSWLTLEADSLCGTPGEGVPDTTLDYIISDGYAADTGTVMVHVIPVNDPPVLDSIVVPELVELDTLTLLFTATDIEDDSLVLSVTPLPAGGTLVDSGNGRAVLVWILDTLSAGTAELAFVAADSSLADTQLVSVMIRSRRPTILGVTVDGLDTNNRVVNHLPEVAWAYADSAYGYPQSAFEIAVGVDTDWEFAEIWNPATVVSGDSTVLLIGAPLLDGETYFLRLRVKNDTLFSDWYQESFRMNSLPEPPTLPDSGTLVWYDVAQPTLVVINGRDDDGDSLTYEFQVFADSLLDSLVDSVLLIAEEQDSTGWTVALGLEENRMYWWRARAGDGYEVSPWSTTGVFVIDISPQPPLPFAAVNLPVDSGATLFNLLPAFEWERAIDPDPFDQVVYRMQLAVDSLFDGLVIDDTLSDTIYLLVDSLAFHGQYWWRLEATDLSHNTTECATRLAFRTWTLGDVTGNHVVNLTDVTRLVNSLFVTFDPIVPYFVADMDASCTVNLTDITYLVGYVFLLGDTPLPGCAPPLN